MANTITVALAQVGPSTSEAAVRSHRLLVDRPQTKGGDDRGPMGGELLLAALGGCFSSNLLAAIRAREAAVTDVAVSVAGTLAGNPSRFTAITVSVDAVTDDRALLERLVTVAERGCIVANTLRDAVELRIEVAASVAN